MIYVNVELNIGGSYFVPVSDLDVILEEIRVAVEEEDMDCEWTVKLIELTDEEVASFPEFSGH